MIVFEVFLNGRRVARAGADDLGVLSANVAAVGKLGSLSTGMPSNDKRIHLSVGGLTARKLAESQQVDWLSGAQLKIGDEIQIRVTEADSAERPKSRKRAKPRPHVSSVSKSRSTPRRRSPTKRSTRPAKTQAR